MRNPSLSVNSNLIESSLEKRSIDEFPFSDESQKAEYLTFFAGKMINEEEERISKEEIIKIKNGTINRYKNFKR